MEHGTIDGIKTKAAKRKRESKAFKTLQFFTFQQSTYDERNELIEWYRCNECGEDKNGTKKSNLSTHLQKKHPETYNRHIIDLEKDHFRLKRMRLLHNCVELVTVNGRSFTHIADSGFQ